MQRINYLRALVLHQTIWDKDGGLTRIHHGLSNNYYKCLLVLRDLSPIAAMSEVELKSISDKQWGKIAQGRQPQLFVNSTSFSFQVITCVVFAADVFTFQYFSMVDNRRQITVRLGITPKEE